MANKAPGKHFRQGLSTKDFYRMFPDDASAEQWFIEYRWFDGITCPRCGSDNVQTGTAHKTMPFRCRKSKKRGTCGKPFSVKTGTFMEASNLGYQDWLYAMYLVVTNLKSVASMKMHRELGITQKSAWHLVHRIRKVWTISDHKLFNGPVEADEVYIGGLEKNKHESKKLKASRGSVGKAAVVGVKDRDTNEVRATVVERTNAETLQGFVRANTDPEATVYTDEASAYTGVAKSHKSVKHSVGEYVRGQAHTNGIESFWSMLKSAHKGTFHKLSAKHLHRYVSEFAGRHNIHSMGTLDQMRFVVLSMDGAQLRYKDLVR